MFRSTHRPMACQNSNQQPNTERNCLKSGGDSEVLGCWESAQLRNILLIVDLGYHDWVLTGGSSGLRASLPKFCIPMPVTSFCLPTKHLEKTPGSLHPKMRSAESGWVSVRVKWKTGMKAKDTSCLYKASSYDSISNTASEALGRGGDVGAVDGPHPRVELHGKKP